ncbi:branched-chain-amino-acid transaminase [Elusimicrobiota bacterium]
MKIYLNGKLVEKEKATISVFDHGLLYGDGVFEGIRIYKRKIFRLNEHLDRFYASAKAIALNISCDKGRLEKAIIETVRTNKLDDGYIRLICTRGIGDLGLDPNKCKKVTLIIIADRIELYPEEYYTKGLSVIITKTIRNMPEALNPCVKSLNYLNNIMGKIEANRAGVPEAIMLNHLGFVAECTGDNIFIYKNGVLITPPISAGALEGITRDAVMEIAKRLNINVKEELFKTDSLYSADECFLTGTAAEVIPVVKINDKLIGNGKPGKVTTEFIQEFRNLAHSTGTEVYTK